MNVLLALAAGLIAAGPLGPGDHTRKLTVDGRERSYLVHIPPQYDPKKPTPVVLVLHGAAMNGQMNIGFTGMNDKSDQAGFIAVYPNGTGTGSFLTWNAGGWRRRNLADDAKFIGALLDDLTTVVNVDAKRVYATGMSNGGMMCYRLAAELSDRIAAISPVAGTMTINDPKPTRPVSVMHFHGTADRLVPFNGLGQNAPKFLTIKSVHETIRVWCRINGCPEMPKVTQLRHHAAEGRPYRAKASAARTDSPSWRSSRDARNGHLPTTDPCPTTAELVYYRPGEAQFAVRPYPLFVKPLWNGRTINGARASAGLPGEARLARRRTVGISAWGDERAGRVAGRVRSSCFTPLDREAYAWRNRVPRQLAIGRNVRTPSCARSTSITGIQNMRIRRIEHVGIVVNDLPAAKAFFLDLGFGVQWEGELEGELVDRVVGLHGVRTAVVVVGFPEGQAKLELVKFHTPSDESGIQRPLANTLGIRHIAFLVDDIEAIVATLRAKGAEVFGEIQTYGDTYKLCYVRGPEGVILELAEQIK